MKTQTIETHRVTGGELPAGVHRAMPIGRVVIILGVAAFAVWLGIRVRAAQHTKAELAAQLAAGHDGKEAAAAVVSRRATVVSGVKEGWTPRVPLDGTLQAIREADLSFKTPGRLGAIRVAVGDRVKAGDTLASLEQTEAAAQVQAASGGVRAAEAQLALAEDGARRTTALVDARASAAATAVQADAQRKLASANVEVARAQLALARATLSNHVLAAPFGGIVTRVPSGTGGVVAPGIPLFHLTDTSRLKLVATVSESDTALVHVGDPVRIELVDGGRAEAKITAVLPAVDPATRRVPVEAEIDNERQPPLLGGQFVRASVGGGAEIPVVRLPASTLRPGSQDEVMVVRDGKLVARRVVFAVAGDGSLLVRRGLDDKDQVLGNPQAEARDGDRVEVAGERRP